MFCTLLGVGTTEMNKMILSIPGTFSSERNYIWVDTNELHQMTINGMKEIKQNKTGKY